MNLSQFPERFRAKVLSSIVRHGRVGISIRFGKLEGATLPLQVSQSADRPEPLPTAELEAVARNAFMGMPYDLKIRVQ